MKPKTVRWIDSGFYGGWHDEPAESYAPVKVKTIGYVVREDDEAIVLCSSVADNGEILNIVVIPKVAIV